MQTDFTVQFFLDREAVMLKVGESSMRRQILPRDSDVAPLVAIKRPTGADHQQRSVSSYWLAALDARLT